MSRATGNEATKTFLKRFGRFFGVGVLNALGTLVIYQVLLGIVGYTSAYVISFICGVIFSAYANSRFVFGERLTAVKFLRFAVFYTVSFAAGLGLLTLLIEAGHIDPRLAPFIVAIVMMPINFAGARLILGVTSERPNRDANSG